MSPFFPWVRSARKTSLEYRRFLPWNNGHLGIPCCVPQVEQNPLESLRQPGSLFRDGAPNHTLCVLTCPRWGSLGREERHGSVSRALTPELALVWGSHNQMVEWVVAEYGN